MNEHLNIDDIIKFVSIDDLSEESVRLTVLVNGHIRKCNECLRLVAAFQMIYDEFVRLSTGGDFRNYIFDEVLSHKANQQWSDEMTNAVNLIKAQQ